MNPVSQGQLLERYPELWTLLARVRNKERDTCILTLALVHGSRLDEVAREVGVSQATVKRVVRAAQHYLRAQGTEEINLLALAEVEPPDEAFHGKNRIHAHIPLRTHSQEHPIDDLLYLLTGATTLTPSLGHELMEHIGACLHCQITLTTIVSALSTGIRADDPISVACQRLLRQLRQTIQHTHIRRMYGRYVMHWFAYGEDVAQGAFPAVATHLATCGACHESLTEQVRELANRWDAEARSLAILPTHEPARPSADLGASATNTNQRAYNQRAQRSHPGTRPHGGGRTAMEDQPIRWNIFARELEDILTSHGFRLGLIDNRTTVHPEKVRRLQHSLQSPKHFPTLNPDELEEVITAFTLTAQEVLTLRAALIATAVEALLMGRIQPEAAYAAAYQVFHVVLQALPTQQADLSHVRRPDDGSQLPADDSLEAMLDPVLTLLDHALLAQHLSQYVSSHDERIVRLRESLQSFTFAMDEMEALPEQVRASALWSACNDEAHHGRQAALGELHDLG